MIRRLAEHPRLSSESIAEAANQLGLSGSILYKLLQRYRRRPQTSSLLPWKRGRKLDESLLDDEREALLHECIDEFYLRPERPSLAACSWKCAGALPVVLLIIWHTFVRIIWHTFVPGAPRWPAGPTESSYLRRKCVCSTHFHLVSEPVRQIISKEVCHKK